MAAINYLSPVDLNLNELKNAVVHKVATDVVSPMAGQFWYNTTTNLLKYYTGSATIVMYDASTAATGSKLVLRTSGGDINAVVGTFDSVTINNTPSASTDAATKGYVDSLSQGLYWKDAVRVASTANVTISSPGSSIDGVTLSNGDRVLLKNQTTGSQNGLYVFNGSSSAMTRATDADTSGELPPGATTWVNEGTTNADTSWTLTNDSVTLGTTSLTWTQSGGINAITAAAPLSKSGNQISLSYTARLTNNGGSLDLASGVVSAGTYTRTTVDTYGRVTAGAEIVSGTGLVTNTAAGTYTNRSVAAGTGVSVTNGNGVSGNPTVAIDSAVVTQKYAATITGNGSSTSFTVTHSLGTQDVVVQVQDSSRNVVYPDIQANSTSQATISFGAAPANGVTYRVIVHG